MKTCLLILSCLIFSLVFAQDKESLIKIAPLDSVVQYEGEGEQAKGNCLIIKLTADPQQLFNELINLHVLDKDQIERSENTLAIYNTTKPYWVYGKYSVFATIYDKDNYQLIEIYFKAYSNPYNYKMVPAAEIYQKIVNKLAK